MHHPASGDGPRANGGLQTRPGGQQAHGASGLLSRRGCFKLGLGSVGAALFALRSHGAEGSPQFPGLVLREFIYEEAEFPSCHASTIEETANGLVAAWFGGTAEGRSDVCIYLSRRAANGWSPPERVAEGVVEGEDRRHPCWNPVLFQPRQGPLYLFYKVGPSPRQWWGMARSSEDGGRTWSAPWRLPEGQLGPIRAKPIELADGTILCGSSTEHAGWRVQMEFTRDPTGEWSRTPPLNEAGEWDAIQLTILRHPDGRLQILCRSRQQSILEAWSEDSGRTWSKLTRTALPNPSAGIDAVNLADGRFLLVYNHAPRGRGVLNVAVSSDGRTWRAGPILENEDGAEFSYPAVIQAKDGRVHITYTWKRKRIRHVVLDPNRIETVAMPAAG